MSVSSAGKTGEDFAVYDMSEDANMPYGISGANGASGSDNSSGIGTPAIVSIIAVIAIFITIAVGLVVARVGYTNTTGHICT